MTAARRPEPREQILEAAVASLTQADIPPAEQDGWLDPDADPPADLIALPDAELEELLAAAPARPPPPPWPLSYPDPGGPGGAPWPAGSGPEDGTAAAARFASGSAGFAGGAGGGFAEGGPLDALAAGMPPAGFADDAHARLAALTDDKLIGVLRAWRRQASWARAGDLIRLQGGEPMSDPSTTPGRSERVTEDPHTIAHRLIHDLRRDGIRVRVTDSTLPVLVQLATAMLNALGIPARVPDDGAAG